MTRRGQYDNIFEDLHLRRVEEDVLSATEAEQQAIKPGWYVQSSYIGVRIGPLKTKAEADSVMRLSPRSRARQKVQHGTDYPFPHDMKVWEELPKRKKRP